MKVNELRKGNYLNRVGRVFKIDSQDIYLMDSDSSIHKDFEPIPLTEEWLQKFGGKYHKGMEYTWTFGQVSIYERGEVYGFYDGLTEIKYLHQLQNLYFALTGEELEAK